MGVISTIKRVINMLFEKDIEELFGVKDITSSEMGSLIAKCGSIYQGRPPWLSRDDNIKTINFAKVICSETARLTTLAIKMEFNENARGQWLQDQFDGMYFRLRHWVEYGNAYGIIILKPTGDGIDMFLPGQFMITSVNGKGEIGGIVFKDWYQDGDYYYTRFEQNIVSDGLLTVINKAFRSTTQNDKGKPIELSKTKWSTLMPEAYIQNVERLPIGVYRTPEANNVDIDSVMGMPQFKEALEELRDLDIAYSRNAIEIDRSSRIVLADERITHTAGKKIGSKPTIKIADFVKNVFGNDVKEFYQEINPELNTEKRILGINQQLDMIGFKAGYSPGYFKFDGKTGMVTATQVEADDRRTIQLIKDHRDKLEDCLDGLIYALNVFADLYDLAPVGEYEVTYSFGDITYNYEEDKLTWWKYRLQGDVPPWRYYNKFEGMSEDDAKAMIEESQKLLKDNEPKLFEEE